MFWRKSLNSKNTRLHQILLDMFDRLDAEDVALLARLDLKADLVNTDNMESQDITAIPDSQVDHPPSARNRLMFHANLARLDRLVSLDLPAQQEILDPLVSLELQAKMELLVLPVNLDPLDSQDRVDPMDLPEMQAVQDQVLQALPVTKDHLGMLDHKADQVPLGAQAQMEAQVNLEEKDHQAQLETPAKTESWVRMAQQVDPVPTVKREFVRNIALWMAVFSLKMAVIENKKSNV